MTDQDFISHAKKALRIEQDTISQLIQDIGPEFIEACKAILKCQGKIIVTGMGKSGHIAGKIAATFASTGTPAFFIHPSEAAHGDMGMIANNDTIIAISNSGETEEVLLVMEYARKKHLPLIAITSRSNSRIASGANIHLNLKIDLEACPLGLAPTASTTATLALGDALAVSCLKARGFTKQDFIDTHPSGSLGNSNNIAANLMHSNLQEMPTITDDTNLVDALQIATDKGFGLLIILNAENNILGIITDGDIRRTLLKNVNDPGKIKNLTAAEVMTKGCITITPNTPIPQCLNIMSRFKITSLLVEDEESQFAGILHIHDLIKQSNQSKANIDAK